MKGFIYKITNKLNNKVYIGQTIQSVKERFYQHCAKSCDNAVKNMAIHRAIEKYGKENFTIEILEETENLDEREIFFIRLYDSYNNGYNSTKGGQLGFKPFKNVDSDLIIQEYKKGSSLRKIGKLLNIDKATVKDLLIRKGINLRTTRTYKYSQKDRENIIEDFNSGVSRKDIILKYGVSKSYLSQLINGFRRI